MVAKKNRAGYNPCAKAIERLRRSGDVLGYAGKEYETQKERPSAYASLLRMHTAEPERRALCAVVHGLTGPRFQRTRFRPQPQAEAKK